MCIKDTIESTNRSQDNYSQVNFSVVTDYFSTWSVLME